MCLSVPAKVLTIKGNWASVSVRGASVNVSLQLLDEVYPGDYVLIHAGFALEKINKNKALESLRLLDEIDLSASPRGEKRS